MKGLHHVLGDVQPKTHATHGGLTGIVGPEESVEDLPLILF